MYADVDVHVYVDLDVYVNVYVYVYTHIYIYTHTHMYVNHVSFVTIGQRSSRFHRLQLEQLLEILCRNWDQSLTPW